MSLCLNAQMTEAEHLYKQCVTDAQNHQDELERVKEKIVIHIRKLICQGDTVLKEVSWFEVLFLVCLVNVAY